MQDNVSPNMQHLFFFFYILAKRCYHGIFVSVFKTDHTGYKLKKYFPAKTELDFNVLKLQYTWHKLRLSVCVCVCVCVCVRVFVTNQDIDLYNDTGMTQVLQGEGDFSGHCSMSPLFKNAYKSYRVRFFWGKLKCTVSCEG